MIGLDTNVLVRFLVQDDQSQAVRATRLMEERCTADDPGYVGSVVLCELVWVLESAYGYARPLIADVIGKVLHTAELEVESPEAAWEALRAYRTGNADFSGALVGLLNREAGCVATATFDRAAAALDDFFEVPLCEALISPPGLAAGYGRSARKVRGTDAYPSPARTGHVPYRGH